MSGAEDLQFPANWDVLAEPVDPGTAPPPPPSRERAGALTRLGAAVADLVLLLAGTVAGTGAALAAGLPVGWEMVPFAAGAAALAWGYATAVLLAVRRTWPGAALLGCSVPDRPDPSTALRWATLLLTAALLLGVPAALAGDRGPWRGLAPAG